jgi:pilus retraction protein PilT
MSAQQFADDQSLGMASERPLSEIILDMVEHQGEWSDIHLEAGQPLMLRRGANEWEPGCDGDGKPILVSMSQMHALLNAMYEEGEETSVLFDKEGKSKTPEWELQLKREMSLHPAHYLAREPNVIARLRCSVQRQGMGDGLAIVLRLLRDVPKDMAELGLPPQIRKLTTAPSGLILVTGPTGSGKSTTIAAMIDHINSTRRANIVLIEDPVEFVHERKLSIINQREVGVDVASYAAGVRDALRFVPDVIVIGEIRDAETAAAALRAGESGHLVLATMHAPTACAAIRTMRNLLKSPTDGIALSNALRGVVAQALLRGAEGTKHRHLAYEVLHCLEPSVRESIADADPAALDKTERALREGELGGESIPMQRILLELVKTNKVLPRIAATAAHDEALRKELLVYEASNRPSGLSAPGIGQRGVGPFNAHATMVFTAQGVKK